jgi:hypothetical protein
MSNYSREAICIGPYGYGDGSGSGYGHNYGYGYGNHYNDYICNFSVGNDNYACNDIDDSNHYGDGDGTVSTISRRRD